jgi:hypothetical protein
MRMREAASIKIWREYAQFFVQETLRKKSE